MSIDQFLVAAQNTYRLHRFVFITLNVVMTLINIATGAPWWGVTPLLITGLVFSIHFFLYKSMTVDEGWADERIDELRWRAYDLGHVEDLEDRIRADDFSTRPAHRRDPDWWLKRDENGEILASELEADEETDEETDDAPTQESNTEGSEREPSNEAWPEQEPPEQERQSTDHPDDSDDTPAR
jgi:hypothetical protein